MLSISPSVLCYHLHFPFCYHHPVTTSRSCELSYLHTHDDGQQRVEVEQAAADGAEQLHQVALVLGCVGSASHYGRVPLTLHRRSARCSAAHPQQGCGLARGKVSTM